MFKSILNFLFPETVVIGGYYIHREDKANPFMTISWSVKVIDVRGGWVLYRYRDTARTNSMEINIFNRIYCNVEFTS
jgi:hypothetical protein